MKLTALSGFVFVFICLLCSCQKDIPDYVNGAGDSTSSNSNSTLVKYYTEDLYSVSAPDQHTRDSFGLTYDDKGRLLSLIQLDSVNGLKQIYQYNNNFVTLDQYDNGALDIHEIAYLNSFSFADSTLQYDTESDTTTEKYIYNASKQLVQLNTYDYSASTSSELTEFDTYTYDNYNDVVSETDIILGEPNDTSVITSTYPSHIGNNLNIGLGFYQNESKYLPEVVTSVSVLGTEVGTHIYTFDNKKRLIMDKVTTNNGFVATKNYYY